MAQGGIAEIAFDVQGWPPVKNEATSMLAVEHPQHDRVRRLLEAAETAAQLADWTVVSVDIALDVTVRTPTPRPPADATNYLGGIADVLQDKTKPFNIDLSHLGPLQGVALYRNDRQISRISYRTERAEVPSYQVRISTVITS
jgi:hypothetical protein